MFGNANQSGFTALALYATNRDGRIDAFDDVWITFGSGHEVRAFRERKKRSIWFRGLVENCVVYGDRVYRGCEGVIVCDCKDMRAKRLVDGLLKQIDELRSGKDERGRCGKAHKQAKGEV